MNRFFAVCTLAVFMIGCGDDDPKWGPCWNDYEKLSGAGGLYRITDVQNAKEETIALTLNDPHLRCNAPHQYIHEQRRSDTMQEYYEIYIWSFLGENDLPDIRMVLLGEERFVNAFDTYAQSNILTQESFCEKATITVTAGKFNTTHCIYASADGLYRYETYHDKSSKASKRPLGGLIYYVSYHNDVTTYKIELEALGDHITSTSL